VAPGPTKAMYEAVSPASYDITAKSDNARERFDAFERTAMTSTDSFNPGLSTSQSWHKPLPPVRFPLRDALLSLQESAQGPLSARTAAAQAKSLSTSGPFIVSHTAKSRALKKVGRARRKGEHMNWGYAEERPLGTPRAPPEADRPATAPKSVPSAASRSKLEMIRTAQESGTETWPAIVEKSQSAPDLHGGPSHMSAGSVGMASTTGFGEIRPTWTSAARTVLGHSRRQAMKAKQGLDSEDDGPPGGLSRDSSWCGMSLASKRDVPRPVKDWAGRGLEFTDSGLGIGDRFDLDIIQASRRSPGPVYDQVSFGSVALFKPQASQPTKQPESRHTSAEAHKMGARRNISKKYQRQPGPGYYDLPGFTDELLRSIAKRPSNKVPQLSKGKSKA